MNLFLATSNRGKKEELKRLLGGNFKIIDSPFTAIAEGEKMEENARLKATTGLEISEQPSLGEDSGLFVIALNNAPGAFSSRFGTNDTERIQRLLAELNSCKNRKAYFVSVIALAQRKNVINIFQGRCSGRIALHPAGNQGFGYDPIFIPDGYKKSFGELGPQVKDKISHRAKAIRKLKKYLNLHRGVAQSG